MATPVNSPVSCMLWALAVLLFAAYTGAKVVETKLGKLRGKTEDYNGKKVDVYLGVPYAEPPLGHLRFLKPVPKKPWTRTIGATEYGPSCMQLVHPSMGTFLPNTDMSEDCLLLNIYAPVTESQEQRAVMVWIHGGGYGAGQGMATPCQELALHGDVVCVTINYRLNIFGFMSTLDESAPGNFGLWDQHEALKWVKEHISAFGGDPESITIFGESAGGSSVQHHVITKYNLGLVKRAISQSPATFSNGFSFGQNTLNLAKSIALQLSCNTTENPDLRDTRKMTDCLRLAPADMLLYISAMTEGRDSEGNMDYGVRFAPIEDGDFVPYGTQDYFSDFKRKNVPEIDEAFGKVDWMVGSLSDEGNLMLYMAALMQGLHGYNFTEGIPEDVMNTKLIPPILKTFYSENLEMVKKYIHDFYTHKADRIENTLAYRDMFSDIMFNQHIPESSLAHLRTKGTNSQASTYSYHITHVLSGHSIVDFMFGLSLPPWATCASHADDVPLTFGKGYFVSDPTFTWTEEDQRAADVVMTYWTNFAKTGNPNQGLRLEGVATWEEYTKDKKGYINIGKQTEMGYDLLPERMKLWMYTIPEEIERERAFKQKSEL